MLREGPLKYVHCPGDPDLLYDLESDPLELENLADLPESAATVTRLRAEVARRWNLETLEREVRASQQQRLFVQRALAVGQQAPWDYVPPDSSSSRYVRGRDFWEPFGRARLRR